MTQNSIIWRKGKHVVLRPIAEEDLPLFQKWINDPCNNQFLTRNTPTSWQDELDWFQTVSRNGTDSIFLSVCKNNDEKELLGNMSMNINLSNRSAETGTIIGPNTEKGKGYATEAKMLLLDYAFNWLDIRKVTSRILAHNQASQTYATRCGYRLMAKIEKEHFRSGEWIDELLFVVFANEWKSVWNEYKKKHY